MGEWFATWFTVVIFAAFMNCMEMFLQISWMRKLFTTWFTIVIFVAFMKCVNMFLQRSCFRKWFTTRFTFVVFMAFMNCIDMFLQRYFLCKELSTHCQNKKINGMAAWLINEGKVARKLIYFLLSICYIFLTDNRWTMVRIYYQITYTKNGIEIHTYF